MDRYDIGFIIIILLAITATYRFCDYIFFKPTQTEIRILPNNYIKQIENGKGLQAIDRLPIPVQEN